jgi:hypothetical protein
MSKAAAKIDRSFMSGILEEFCEMSLYLAVRILIANFAKKIELPR